MNVKFLRLRGALLPALAAACAPLLTAPEAAAAPLPVNHASFENANFPGGSPWTNDLTDADPATTIEWDGRDGNSSGLAFIEQIGGFVAHGSFHLGMEVGYYVFQDTDLAWEPNTRYTLTVAVGNRNTGFTLDTNLSVIGLTNEIPTAADTGSQLATDPLLAAASASTNADFLADSTFQDLQLVYDTDEDPPSGSIVIFLGDNSGGGRSHFDHVRLDAIGLGDEDMDGLPTEWELDNGLSDNDDGSIDPDNGPGGDPDMDGLTNLQEYNGGMNSTDPQVADTDADGLEDGDEVAIGTDPLNPDTDGDTLTDGAEINDHQTSPLLADTDGDQFEDQAEIALGSNPDDGGDVPSLTGDVVIGVNFVGGILGGAAGTEVNGTAGFIDQANWNNLEDAMGSDFILDDSTDTPTVVRIDWVADGTFALNAEVPFDEDAALMRGYLRTRNGVPTNITVSNIAYPLYDVYLYADDNDTGTMSNYTVNGQTYSDVLDRSNWPVAEGGDAYVPVLASDRAGNYLVFRDLTGPTLTIGATNAGGDNNGPINGFQIVRAEVDTDGDGMPDIYEVANGLNPNADDTGGDLDSDGDTNGEEFAAGTKPADADTDDDGYRDGDETGTGTFVSLTDTGTDPLNHDTDGDTLIDGIEDGSLVYNGMDDPGTNPTLIDTDGDNFDDAFEIDQGTNPVLASDRPPVPPVLGYWPFDDGVSPTTDLSDFPTPGTVNGGAVFVPGHSGLPGDMAIAFDGVDDSVTTGVPLLSGLTEFTMMGWVRYEVPQEDRDGFFGQNNDVEFGLIPADTLLLYTPAASPSVFLGSTLPEWTHVTVRGDATEQVLYINGERAATGAGTGEIGTEGVSFNIGGDGVFDETGNFFEGEIDDVALYDIALPDAFIRAIANEEITPLGTVPSGSGNFMVTDIDFDPVLGLITLVFNSQPGQSYELEYLDESTGGAWFGLDDVLATESTTQFESGIPDGTEWRLFRVRRQ